MAAAQESDIEKALSSDGSSEEEIAPYVEQRQAEEARDVTTFRGKLAAFTIRLSQYGVETRGVVPTAPEARTDTRFWNLLFLWISANFNILAFSTGSLGPAIFALGLKESLLVIFFINLLSATLPAYFSTFGPRLGMRQMIVSRYSFGFYGNIIPSLLNLITFMGFLILNLILGGETLAAVSGYQAGHGGGLSWDIGIAIVTFCGYKVLYTYERFAWIPIVMVYIVALGCGGKQLTDLAPVVPASSVTVLCFAASIAGYMISWSTLASDYTIYLDQSAPNSKVFLFAYSGFFFPNVICEMVGAAFAVSMHAPGNEAWLDGYKVNNVGGLLDEVMRPAGGFGKFCIVLLALSCIAASSRQCMYSFCFDPTRHGRGAHLLHLPHLIHRRDRILGSRMGKHRPRRTRPIPSVPHGRPETAGYDSAAWNDPSALPTGIPALAAFALSFALIVPAMNQVWFQGPIGRRVGDIGFELAFIVAGGLYSVFRHVEKKVCVGRAWARFLKWKVFQIGSGMFFVIGIVV
ncbi:Permease for cytosine/purines, uracil, thiamine, allantoin [Rhizoctonia solani]|uniref:Permease for cytosine/purines, uracil, thiamine, allantoin n=1 Tax=Rhizoctonia solani TaxID=456999 RepID=A0A8H8SUI1_9AGAM|nr:Permease for cytosine/purines, uracil, thiamine, allantoin [Rhizoctonia solani]QRW18284.1 Permease for cytosine/purines, uracil, thiamine, allantoin [Rhizoctonia solani]